ncbi:MAG: hypothetical protein JMN27_18275 [gamma proteobacterium endosymbiont of Lamellibrachia anaximandri]|nr:hypothetical protein [gamma proteobacterium endosymbiont of Lamellibrachia anaximandri]MBL3535752.1 hypothetical protein [gamma proteobacterium endosymbiont of Lamellibrachia anaximandri]
MHNVITKDYPENQSGGIMICGINFGYSAYDEKLDDSGITLTKEQKSYFSDTTVNNTKFRNRILNWLKSWDIISSDSSKREHSFERSFFQTNWLMTQTNSVSSDKKISVNYLVQEADSILGLLASRKPQAILFFGMDLIEALNDISIRDQVEAIFGSRSGNAIIHRIQDINTGRCFRVLTQSFGCTQIIGLPHPQARGLSDEQAKEFGSVVKPIIVGVKNLP